MDKFKVGKSWQRLQRFKYKANKKLSILVSDDTDMEYWSKEMCVIS